MVCPHIDCQESSSFSTRHVASEPKPRVACIMMQKNEDDLLEPWIAYHGRMFGYENLFVFDNGSTNQRVLKTLEKYVGRINLMTNRAQKIDFERKGEIIGALITSLEQNNGPDFFLPLDCDEFVALDSPGGGISCSPESVAAYLGGLAGDPRVLTIKRSYFNVPGQPLQFYRRDGRKCFFASGSFLALDIGYHQGKSRHTNEEYQTEIVHVHFQNKPFQTFQTHAKQKLEGRIPNFLPETLARYRGRGYHLCRYLLMSEEEYLHSFDHRRKLRLPSFEAAMHELGLAVPFSTVTQPEIQAAHGGMWPRQEQ